MKPTLPSAVRRMLPGMRVAAELVVPEQRTDVEAEDQLADVVALVVRTGPQRIERRAVDVLGDQDPGAAELGNAVGDLDKRVTAVVLRDVMLCAGLPQVVQLAFDVPGDLLQEAARAQCRPYGLAEFGEEREVAHVSLDRRVDAGILNLDGDVATVAKLRAINLPDRCRGDGDFVEIGECLCQRADIGLDDILHRRERNRGRVIAQRCELFAESLPVRHGHHIEVEHRQHLAQLHRGTLHAAEHRDELVRGFEWWPVRPGCSWPVSSGRSWIAGSPRCGPPARRRGVRACRRVRFALWERLPAQHPLPSESTGRRRRRPP